MLTDQDDVDIDEDEENKFMNERYEKDRKENVKDPKEYEKDPKEYEKDRKEYEKEKEEKEERRYTWHEWCKRDDEDNEMNDEEEDTPRNSGKH